ncbi:hypothetical protein [Wenjunlia tyrosinilytica]|uniref:hypothetical protein n=1 Tax=Wenjunlia tyrosinilytica TaxID=1544741 RepID=UPI0016672EAA|nr:hypothetical protein [Wenjunlia tyrosinilytica]
MRSDLVAAAAVTRYDTRLMTLFEFQEASSTAAAFQTALALLLPGRVNALARYRARVEGLLRPGTTG